MSASSGVTLELSKATLASIEGDQDTEQAQVETVNMAASKFDDDFQSFQAAQAAITSYRAERLTNCVSGFARAHRS